MYAPQGGLVQRSWRSSCVASSAGAMVLRPSRRVSRAGARPSGGRDAHDAARSAREGGSAQAQERPSPGMRSAPILYAPEARLAREGEGGGVVRGTRRAGEGGDARAFEYALAVTAGSQGPPAPLRSAARREGAWEGRWR